MSRLNYGPEDSRYNREIAGRISAEVNAWFNPISTNLIACIIEHAEFEKRKDILLKEKK